MKSCLIIASPRSGSSNLMRSIAKANNLLKCFEPFGDVIEQQLKINNYCTKVIGRRKPVEFWVELSSKFDKVVLQSRRDSLQAAESFTKLYTSKTRNPDMKWTSLTEEERLKLPIAIDIINISEKVIEDLSLKLDIDIDYYEDIFTNYYLNDTSIKLDLSFLNKSRKCKIEKFNAI